MGRQPTYTTELLHKHDNLASQEGSSVARHTDNLQELVLTNVDVFLCSQQLAHVELISRSLDLVVSKTAHRVVGCFMASLRHVPTRRLGAHEDEAAHDDGWEHGGCHHDSPVETGHVGSVWDVVECQVCGVSDLHHS